jgi:hypothetical protein
LPPQPAAKATIIEENTRNDVVFMRVV